jgi:hypothetical protein
METKKLVAKLMLLAALVVGVFSVGWSAPVQAEETEHCGKCDRVYQNGVPMGYGCFGVSDASHRCRATVDGCDFPEGSCTPNSD